MNKGCSIRELARHLGLSTCTVSKALNDPDYPVSPRTRERIVEAARRLEYQPNINAKRLFSKHSDVIGLITPSHLRTGRHILDDNHLTHIISGMEEVFTAHRYRLMLLFNDEEFLKRKEYLSVFQQRLLDGLLIWGAYSAESFWEELTQRNYPHLFITTCPENLATACDMLSHDYEAGGYLMMKHLLERGHRRIFWCPTGEDSSVNRMLDAGIGRALTEFGLDAANTLLKLHCGYDHQSGIELARRILDADHGATAILTPSRRTASGVLDHLTSRGINVPEKYAVAGCDSQNFSPGGITRIIVDDLELGRKTADRIIELIEQPDTPRSRRPLPVKFLQGTTT